MTYVGYFDVWNLAWKSRTPNPLKNRGHRPPKFWFWMKFAIKTSPSPSLHRWSSWPPYDLYQVFWCIEPSQEVSDPQMTYFIQNQNLTLPAKVHFFKIPDVSCPEANQAIFEVMMMFWLKISSKIRTLEASGPIFEGGLGLRLLGKVQYNKIPDISCLWCWCFD